MGEEMPSGGGAGAKFKEDSEDLVSNDDEQENWSGIAIALLVIAIILSLIVTSIIMLTPPDKGPRVKNERIKLDEFLQGQYEPRYFNGTWISEKEMLFRAPSGGLVVFNAETLNEALLVSNISFSQLHAEGYSLSANRLYLLVRTKSQHFTSRSYYAHFIVYNTTSERAAPLISAADVSGRLRYATWGPTGSQLAYVADGNLYYVARQGGIPQMLTTSGSERLKLNGVPDISYEEILNSNNAIWWSDDGSMIAYISFDLTDVNYIKVIKYGSYEEAANINPVVVEQRYPKPGTPVPKANLYVVDLRDVNFASKEIQPPKSYRQQDHYIGSVSWIDNRRLLVIWMNRPQNQSIVSICGMERRWECEKHIEENSATGWLDMNEDPIITSDKWHYFLRLPVTDGKAGNFRHVNMVDINSKGFKTILTHGRYDVVKILAHRFETRSVYYLSTLPHRRGQRHLYFVTDMRSPNPRDITCLTCNNTVDCLYHNAIFSPGAKYFVLECMGPDIPRIELWSTDLQTPLYILDTNNELRELTEIRAMPQIKRFMVALSSGTDAYVQVMLPPGLSEEEIIRYPLVLQVDGSPGNQLVSEKFEVNWGSYLASKKDIIYVTVDGRGSGYHGDRYLHEVYRQLGTAEVWDPLEVVRSMVNDLHYVDTQRVCVWGWGYGGYSTIMTLASDLGVFTCGIAIAPITNWRYYDAAFVERYMLSPKPEDNYISFEKSNVNLKAANLKDKKFLLIHGTADEQVHFQHSVMLMKALVVAGLSYQTQVYPDQNHSLYGVTRHLHATMERFLDSCFVKPKKGGS